MLKRFFKSEVGAIVLWALSTLLIAAVIAPWFYQWGKQLAATAAQEDLSGFLEWLGAACGRAKLGRFYNRAVLFSALCLLPILIHRIKAISKGRGATKIINLEKLAPLQGMQQVLAAFLIAGAILWMNGLILAQLGAFASETKPVDLSRIVTKCALPAIGASLVEEWLFRGLLLSLWLRVARPASACIGSSLLFAFLHFLKPPAAIVDPTHPLAGFELLGQTLLHFTEPQFFVTDFATLTVVGLILCWVRLRTKSLWFPIGLHAGWVFSFSAFKLFYNPVDHPLHPWGVGDNLRSGVAPMLGLAVTALVCHWVLKRMQRPPSAPHHGDHDDARKSGSA